MIENDTIIGMGRSPDECDRLMFSHVRREWIDYEGALFTSKWFDYRPLNPVDATYLYAHHFKVAYRAAYRCTIDHKAAPNVKPLKKDDLFDCPQIQIAGIWRGRQHADALCMPYNLYIDFAMKARLAYWNRNHLPRPCQLYSEQVVNRVIKQWEDHQRGFLLFGTHSAYKNEAYVGTTAQNDHHEWLFSQIDKRDNGFIPLVNLYTSGLLPIEKITARLGDSVSERVLKAV